MKNTTTKLAAATLFTIALVSQSAMAMNQDSGSYDLLNGKSMTTAELSLTTVSYRSNGSHAISGTSEGGFDSAYVGSTQSPLAVTINNTGDYLSMQDSLSGSLSHTSR